MTQVIVKKNDYLEHKNFKYVKKKKVNGKWRYYYDVKDALGYDEREKAGQAVYRYSRAQDLEKGLTKYYNDEHSRLSKYRGLDPRTGANRLTVGDREYLKDINNDVEKARKKVDSTRRKATKAVQKYYKTPIGQLDRFDDKIDSGRKAVAKTLKKLASKVQPKKEPSLSIYRKAD